MTSKVEEARKKRDRILGEKCWNCKRYSSNGDIRADGYCLKMRKGTKPRSTCGYFIPNRKMKGYYEMECKYPGRR